MKKKSILISPFISIFLIANSFSNVIPVHAQTIKQSLPSPGFVNDFIQPKIHITKKSSDTTPNFSATASTLPSKYDSRDNNLLTDIKNQGQIGACWAFATYGSLESTVLKSQNKIKDYSELSLGVDNGFIQDSEYGGNYYMSTAYLARWSGPVSEVDDPYPNPPSLDNITHKTDVKARSHVQNVIFVPDRLNSTDNNQIKQAVQAYGTVATSINMDTTFLNYTNAAYYCNSTTNTNHAIDIVGWDDSFSKTNFLTTPPADGAFICRNSWGKDFGDNGYFYVSYYDTSIGCYNAAFNNAEPVNNYSEIYQYDPLGMGGERSYGNTNWFSNVFTADNVGVNTQKLTAASFYTTEMNTNYEIYVEPDYTTNGFTNIKNNLVKSGTIDMPGYHTIKFDTPKNIGNGKKFAVAVKIYNPNGCYIVVESTRFNDSSTVVSSAGQSFIGYTGSNWTDVGAGNPNVCLKAFTNITYSVPVTGIGLNSNNVSLNPGQTYSLTATITPTNAIDKNIIWDSSNEEVATVDDSGNVKALSMGQATITATSEDGSFSAKCTVNVKGTIAITSVTPDNNSLSVGAPISIEFNTLIKSGSGIQLTDENNNIIKTTINTSSNKLTITPASTLNYDSTYKLYIPVNAVTDSAGNTMANDYSNLFITEMNYCDNVKFQSPYLEKAVRDELGIQSGKITSNDMKNLSYLYVNSGVVDSLAGLEYATSLNDIDISNNDISDITPLRHLINLNYICLDANKISDISPLKYHNKLSSLWLSGNNISDISPLSNLSSLTSVSLGSNIITDIMPLYNMVNSDDQNTKSSLYIDISDNYINTNDSAVSSLLQNITNSISYFQYSYQNSGLMVLSSYPRKSATNFPTYNQIKLVFKNNISPNTDFGNIEVTYYNETTYEYDVVPVSVTISNNILLIKPNQALHPGVSYELNIPKEALIDSQGTTFTNDYYLSFSCANCNGDVNGDGVTDIKDLAATAQYYNTTLMSGTSWNSNVDLNNDGRIDIYDIVNESKMIN